MNQIILLNETEEEENFLNNDQETLEITHNTQNIKPISLSNQNNILIPKNTNHMPELTFRKNKDALTNNTLKPKLTKTTSDELANKQKQPNYFKSAKNSVHENPDLSENKLFSKKINSNEFNTGSQTKIPSEYDSMQTQMMKDWVEEDRFEIQSIMSQTKEMLSSKVARSQRSQEMGKLDFLPKKSSSFMSRNLLKSSLNTRNSKSNI
jgi:hypothetical protein